MADLEQGDVAPRSAHLSENGDDDVAGLLSPRFEARKTIEREGLPPGFKMRADAHYVDQLSARSAEVPMRLIPVDDIEGPDPVGSMDAGAVHALVRSIAEHGILQPLDRKSVV